MLALLLVFIPNCTPTRSSSIPRRRCSIYQQRRVYFNRQGMHLLMRPVTSSTMFFEVFMLGHIGLPMKAITRILKSIQCVVGRVEDRGKWGLVDRSGPLAHAVFAEAD